MEQSSVTYAIIKPPFTLRFREMPKKTLDAYRMWFHEVIPTRLTELTKVIKSTAGYESWEPDLSTNSLDMLGHWFEGQVTTRKKHAEELEEMRERLTFPIEIPEEELTNRSLSLAMDIGMYFAQVILKSLPGTNWAQPLGNKNFADYGQPVLMGFGTVPLNPVRVIVTTAYAIARGNPARLRELYNTWAKMRK
jgi:hypothetical protein